MAFVTLPNVNQTGTNEWEDVEGNDRALRDVLNGGIENVNIAGNAAIALSKLASGTSAQLIVCNASGVPTYVAATGDVTISSAGVTTIGSSKVTDTMMVSPNNSVYRTLLEATGMPEHDAAATTYALLKAEPQTSPFTRSTIATGLQGFPFISFDDADYTVASKTQKLRVRATVLTNATAPGITFTFGLYPITVAGGADALVVTLGTVVSGTTAAIASPTSSSVTTAVSSDATIPSDGAYMLGVVTSGTLANNAAVHMSAHLQTRHV